MLDTKKLVRAWSEQELNSHKLKHWESVIYKALRNPGMKR